MGTKNPQDLNPVKSFVWGVFRPRAKVNKSPVFSRAITDKLVREHNALFHSHLHHHLYTLFVGLTHWWIRD
jgi:hypothetical protein